jgi:membrane-bound serine protease (ClpP class)
MIMALIVTGWLPQSSVYCQGRIVEVIQIDGTINPSTAEYIHQNIQRANEEGAECLVIQLNTPGGLLKSTRVIVSDILASHVPVVVYVYPAAAQAASAGVFIAMSAHVAAMAPGTNIGAAHPVMMTEGGQPNRKDSLDIMMEKATNDAAAFMRTIAEKRNRNVEWCEKAVRQSVSLTETEAIREKVVDVVAQNMDSLLILLEGREVQTDTGKRTLHTRGAEIRTTEMSFTQKILDILSDPNIAYILMMLGIYGLLFELYNPGSILPGIVGVICLILAFYSLHSLPINYAGLGLIIFAVILFIAEIKVVSHGLLTAGGVVSFLIGSIMLINPTASFEFVTISLSVIFSATVMTALFFVFALGKGIMAQRRQATTGSEGLVGSQGIAISALSPFGQVMVHGEIWSAESSEGKIPNGSKVKVISIEDLKLRVGKI